jgi:hypothetical protein
MLQGAKGKKNLYIDVDVSYPAKTHQHCPRAWCRALVPHPRENLKPVDEVGVGRTQHRREGCELVILSCQTSTTVCIRAC